ncbi:MAG: metallopeptidase TldD-related protein, partial [bacterium]
SERAELAAGGAAVCKRAGLRANGYTTTDTDTTAIANTAGLFASHTDTVAELSCTAVGDGGMAGWAAATERDRRCLDPGTVARRAVEKALKSRRPRSVPAGRYTVVMEPAAVADLLAFWAWEAFGGLAFVEGRSCLSGKIGEKMLHPSVTIVDDAGHPRTMGAPFDAEGAPRQAVTLVDRGTIRGVVHDRITAKRAGVASTGHALPQPNPWGPLAANLVLTPGKDSLESLIGKVSRGLLITEFHYTNVLDPMTLTVTGMTRNGTFLIERGAVGPAVKNMRFTQSLVEAFQRGAGIGKDLEFRRGFFGGGFFCPAIVLDDFTFSSGTQF